jgi:RimJ/RimL family protein N-acetyltransferase
MATLEPRNFVTKSLQSLEIRCLDSDDENLVQSFHKQLADETTHTLRCKKHEIPIDKLKKTLEITHQSPVDLFLGVFDKRDLIASLNFRVPMPNHPWVKHVGEFGMGILKDYWNHGIGKELLRIMEQFATGIGVNRN